MPTMFYLYVDDVDGSYQCALAAGATSQEAPALQPYGERRAAVRDRSGNHWHLASASSILPASTVKCACDPKPDRVEEGGNHDECSRFAIVGHAVEPSVRAAATGGRRLHDLHDPHVARQLRSDRAFRRPPGLHAVQRRRASCRARAGRAPLRLPAPEASVRRQVHAGRGPLRADVLRAVDDPGRGAVPQVSGDGRPPLLRGAGRRDAAGRCAGIPPRGRSAQDAPRGSGSGGSSAVRPGQGAGHPGPRRAHRVDGRHQRRQWRSIGRGRRVGGGEGRVLGHRRRSHGHAEGHRLRGRVRHDGGARPGAQDTGDRAPGRQAATHRPLRQQRRHRRCADRRRGGQEVRGLPVDRSVDLLRVERVLPPGRSRLRPDRGRAQDDGGLGPGGSPSDDRDRDDRQGVLARRSEREDSRGGRSGGGLSEPSVRDEDELGLLRRPGANLRGALRRGVLGHPPGAGDRRARAADPVQDQYRRRHVRARSERPRGLAGRSPGGDRRVRQGRPPAPQST